MTKEIEINLNDYVRVKLSDVGEKILNDYKQHEINLLKESGIAKDKYIKYIETEHSDKDGYHKFLLHELIDIFGYGGCFRSIAQKIPFETTVLKVDIKG